VTLIEILVAVMVLGLVAAGISRMLASSWQSQETLTSQNEMQKRAQRAVDAMIDSLRGYSEIQLGEPARVTAALRDKHGVLLRTITYYLQEGELLRDRYESSSGETITGEIICGDVSSLMFDYYRYIPVSNSWESPPLDLTDTESVKVSVTIASGKNHATETSWVKFRNRQ
jgi:type II secretory pathway pseudopilin PulG